MLIIDTVYLYQSRFRLLSTVYLAQTNSANHLPYTVFPKEAK
jgi:hypothetical protein